MTRFNKTTIITIIAALTLAGCGGKVTEKIDEATGTTLEERCAKRHARIALFDLMEKDGVLTEESRRERQMYRYFVALHCPPVE